MIARAYRQTSAARSAKELRKRSLVWKVFKGMGCCASTEQSQSSTERPRMMSTSAEKTHPLPTEVLRHAPSNVVYSPLDRSSREIRLLRIIDPNDESRQPSTTATTTDSEGLINCELFHARLPQSDPENRQEYLAVEESMVELVKKIEGSSMALSDLIEVVTGDEDIQSADLKPMWDILPSIYPGLVIPPELQTEYTADLTRPTTHFFTALSYVWGDETDKREILVNGCRFKVARNLYAALKQVQSEQMYSSIWIDALCINQADNNEKSHQLRYMPDIYSLARETIIWLGEEENDSALAMSLIQNFQEVVFEEMIANHISAGGTMEDTEVMGGVERAMDIANILNRLDRTLEEPSRHWRAVNALLNRPWFSRVWTLQEVVLARNTSIKVGDKSLVWDKLSTFTSMLYHRKDVGALLKPRGIPDFNSIAPRITGLQVLRGVKEKGLDLKLSELIAVSRGKSCSNWRDFVYGLLGMATDDIVTVDYNHSVEQVFADTTKAIIQASGSLEFMVLVDRASGLRDPLPNLPSWAYPFHQISRVNALLDVQSQGAGIATQVKRSPEVLQEDTFNACGSRRAHAAFSSDHRTLTISGLHFDRIANLGCVFGDSSSALKDPNNRVPSTSFTHNPYHFDAATLEAISTTLILNKFTRSSYDGTKASVSQIWPLIAKPCGQEEYAPLYSVHLWYLANKDLVIGSHTLEKWCQMVPTCKQMTTRGALQAADLTEAEVRVLSDISVSLIARRMVVTERGFVGMVPRQAMVGDVVTILDGCSVPVVLRAVEMDGTTQRSGMSVIGGAYMHGIMNGEAVAQGQQEKGLHSTGFVDVCLV